MLQSSNQVPPTPVPNTAVTTTATVNPIPHMPNNDNNVWAQPKSSIPPVVQPHSMEFD